MTGAADVLALTSLVVTWVMVLIGIVKFSLTSFMSSLFLLCRAVTVAAIFIIPLLLLSSGLLEPLGPIVVLARMVETNDAVVTAMGCLKVSMTFDAIALARFNGVLTVKMELLICRLRVVLSLMVGSLWLLICRMVMLHEVPCLMTLVGSWWLLRKTMAMCVLLLVRVELTIRPPAMTHLLESNMKLDLFFEFVLVWIEIAMMSGSIWVVMLVIAFGLGGRGDVMMCDG